MAHLNAPLDRQLTISENCSGLPFSSASFIFHYLYAPLCPQSGPGSRTSRVTSPPQGPLESEAPILGLGPPSLLYFYSSVPLGVPWSAAQIPGHSWGSSGHCLLRPGLAKAGLGGARKQEAPSPGHVTCYCAVSSRTSASSVPVGVTRPAPEMSVPPHLSL